MVPTYQATKTEHMGDISILVALLLSTQNLSTLMEKFFFHHCELNNHFLSLEAAIQILLLFAPC